MTVRLLTLEQKQMLEGRTYANDSYFYPIQDYDNNWIISEQEVDQCTNNTCMWVKDLPQIEYNPKLEEHE